MPGIYAVTNPNANHNTNQERIVITHYYRLVPNHVLDLTDNGMGL